MITLFATACVLVWASSGQVLTPDRDQHTASEEASGARLQRFESELRDLVRRHRIPGLAVGVVRDGEVVLAAGFGETARGSGTPITTRSTFHMASVSKPFSATAIMQLVEAGKLELDAPLTRYLPYFRLRDEASKSITVRQVLTHRSGMPDVGDYEWDEPQHDEGAAERYVRGLTGEHLVFEPGTAMAYSNMAFDVLGDLIAKVSGMSFEAYQRERILEPLGMGHSSFLPSEIPDALRTRGHSMGVTERLDLPPCPVYPYNRRHAPSSTLNSNVEDMCRWMLANLALGELDGRRILSPGSYGELWSREDDTPGIGLSWFLDEESGRLWINHSGGDLGYGSYLALIPESDLGIVVMANSDRAPTFEIARAAVSAAFGEPYRFFEPSIAVEFARIYEEEGLDAAIERYMEAREAEPARWIFGVGELDGLCASLVRLGRLESALEVASFNSDLYPELCGPYVRLGEVLAASGQGASARECFEIALRLAPAHDGDSERRRARAGLEQLAAH